MWPAAGSAGALHVAADSPGSWGNLGEEQGHSPSLNGNPLLQRGKLWGGEIRKASSDLLLPVPICYLPILWGPSEWSGQTICWKCWGSPQWPLQWRGAFPQKLCFPFPHSGQVGEMPKSC